MVAYCIFSTIRIDLISAFPKYVLKTQQFIWLNTGSLIFKYIIHIDFNHMH